MNRRQFFGAVTGAAVVAELPVTTEPPEHWLAGREFIVFTEEISIEEFKRRWPDACKTEYSVRILA